MVRRAPWILLLIAGILGHAQQKRTSKSSPQLTPYEDASIKIEQQKLDVAKTNAATEKEKVAHEESKLAIDRRQVAVTGLSAGVTLLVAFSGLGFSVWSLQRTNVVQIKLKMLELALNNASSNVAVNRIKLAADVIANNLPAGIKDIEQKMIKEGYGALGSLPTDTQSVRASILTLLASHPEMRAEILQDFATLFPTDGWAEPLRRVAAKEKAGEQSNGG